MKSRSNSTDTVYTAECEVCDNTVEVYVKDVDDEPNYCPMCGSFCEFVEDD